MRRWLKFLDLINPLKISSSVNSNANGAVNWLERLLPYVDLSLDVFSIERNVTHDPSNTPSFHQSEIIIDEWEFRYLTEKKYRNHLVGK